MRRSQIVLFFQSTAKEPTFCVGLVSKIGVKLVPSANRKSSSAASVWVETVTPFYHVVTSSTKIASQNGLIGATIRVQIVCAGQAQMKWLPFDIINE